MTRFKFVAQCLPYAGPPDEVRQNAVADFFSSKLQIQKSSVTFNELAIGVARDGPGSVRPELAIVYDLPADVNHRDVIIRLDVTAQAVDLHVERLIVQQIVSYAVHGVIAGVLSGVGLGSTASSGRDAQDSQSLGMLLGGILGFLIGGTIGSTIPKEGPVLGIWQRDRNGSWVWTPTEQLLPLGRGVQPS